MPTNVEADIRAALSDLASVLEAEDPTAWVYAYTEDAVFCAPGAPMVRGRQELLKMAASMRPLSSVVITPVEIEVDMKVACVLARASWVSGRPPETGPTTTVRGIIVWRKEHDGRWKVSQELLQPDAPTA